MNLGQRIYAKDGQSIEMELLEIENIIYMINLNEEHIPDIDLNLPMEELHKNLEKYIEIVDQKLYDINEKYFEPNGLQINFDINMTDLWCWSTLCVDESKPEVQVPLEFAESDDVREYTWTEDCQNAWEEKYRDRLLAVLNISELGMILGAFWFIDPYEENKFKLITTNRDT